MLSVVVPSYRRQDSLTRLIRSVEASAPDETELVVVLQDDAVVPSWVTVLRREPGYPAGPHRHAGALVAAGDYLLFLDDDHELLPSFRQHWPELRAWADIPAFVSLPNRSGDPTSPRDGFVAIAGGILIRRDVYLRAGGFRDDYLDDIEFCLLCVQAGIPVRRYHSRVSVHHYGVPGGLRAWPAVNPKADAHRRLSRLLERYPALLRPDPRHWLGFRLRGGAS